MRSVMLTPDHGRSRSLPASGCGVAGGEGEALQCVGDELPAVVEEQEEWQVPDLRQPQVDEDGNDDRRDEKCRTPADSEARPAGGLAGNEPAQKPVRGCVAIDQAPGADARIPECGELDGGRTVVTRFGQVALACRPNVCAFSRSARGYPPRSSFAGSNTVFFPAPPRDAAPYWTARARRDTDK